MTPTSFRFLKLATFTSLIFAAPAFAQLGSALSMRWNSPSTLTTSQAADVLAQEASGEKVSASKLFEARKHLRSDRVFSLGEPVIRSVLEKLIAGQFDSEVRIRILPVVLQWLDPKIEKDSSGSEVLRLRGEAVGLIALNADPNLAATLLLHLTIQENWKWCSSNLCLTPVFGPMRSAIGYKLDNPLESAAPAEARSSQLVLASGFTGSVFSQTFSPLDPSRYLGAACDPLPSSTTFDSSSSARMIFTHLAERTEHSRTNRVLCGFFAIPSGPTSRFTYLAAGTIAQAPPSASNSAVVNNPLEFPLFE